MKIRNLIISGLVFTLLSCENILDLNPKTSISEATVWKTEDDLTAATNAIYEIFVPSQNCYDIFGMLDGLTDIATVRTVNQFSPISQGSYDANNLFVWVRWRDNYKGIVRANDVLAHVNDMDDIDDEIKNERKGEALFLRAFFYFNLIYFYGDVPLVLDVPSMGDLEVERTPKSEILVQMHKDLDEAISLLSMNPSDIGRVTKGAALTLKAKFYMQELKFAEAIPILEQVKGLGYKLYNNYRTLFLPEAENNEEVIFDVQYMSNSGKNQGNRFNTLYGNQSLKAGWSWLLPTKNLIELYDTKPNGVEDSNALFDKKDPRMDMTVLRPGAKFVNLNDKVSNYPSDVRNYAHAQTGMHCRKFVIEGSSQDFPFSGIWDAPQNWIFFRYADVLLLYAEAVNEVDGTVPAVYDAINSVRQRASVDMPAIEVGKSQTEMREIIRKERGVELALEGWRFFDLKRWGLLQEVNDGFEVINIRDGSIIQTRVFSDYHNLWPIPLSEIDFNKKLVQNSGW